MTTKIKVLISILAVGIILATGWWIWDNYYRCSIWHPQGCDRSCNIDDDCYPSCQCGCLSLGERCTQEIKCEVPLYGCKCVNGSCEIIEFERVEDVIITTDKTEYEQGETVNITVRNSLAKSIWDFGACGGIPFWGLQKFDESTWKELNFSIPYLEKGKEFCDFIVCERPELSELKPNSEINNDWHLTTICEWPLSPIGVPEIEPKIIEKGIYRVFLIYGFNKDFSFPEGETIFSNEFTIK